MASQLRFSAALTLGALLLAPLTASALDLMQAVVRSQ